MARDFERNDDFGTGDDGTGGFDRRKYLKLLGGATASAAALGAAGSATADEFRTITVPAGGSERITIGSGETLENVLIDISADDADARIIANGSNWTIRNVGFKGSADIGSNSGGFPNLIAAQGTGTIEHVYLGDGVSGDLVRKGAIGVSANHSGHITLREVHMAEWTANAIYAAGMARSDGGGGTLSFDRCYFRDNNIAHIRIASDGSSVKNSVIHNTNNVYVHPFGGGSINSRGIYTGYGDSSQSIDVENTHIDLTSSNTNGASSVAVSQHTTINLRNCETRGSIIGNVREENVGNDPDTSVPSGVPTSPEAAASGEAGGDGGSSAPSAEDVWKTDEPNRVSFSGGFDGVSGYRLEGRGIAEYGDSANVQSDDEYRDTIATDGDDFTLEGYLGGASDDYSVEGAVTAVDVDSDVTIEVNGTEVDPADLEGIGSWEAELEHTLLVDGVGTSDTTRYEFVVSGAAEKATYKGASIDDEDSIESGRITGAVANWRDAFRFAGDLEELTVDGPARVVVDDEEVDPSEYGEDQPNTLTLVGNGSDANYEISVDGTIDPVAGDAAEDHATAVSETTVEGSIERGAQRFQFSGVVTDITFASGSAHVYVGDERVDPDEYGEQELLPHAIVIDGADTDGESTYSFTIDGEVITSSYREATIDAADEVEGRTVSGSVDEELDAYWFDGNIDDFRLNGDASVDVEYNARDQ